MSICQNWFNFFSKYYINPPRSTKDFLNIATLAKIRQIWSNWAHLKQSHCMKIFEQPIQQGKCKFMLEIYFIGMA